MSSVAIPASASRDRLRAFNVGAEVLHLSLLAWQAFAGTLRPA